MVTSIPTVTVSRAEAGQFFVHCSCGSRMMRGDRRLADEAATEHLRSHAQPDPSDQMPELDLREVIG